MKNIFTILLCLVCASCTTPHQYTVKVIKHYPDYYAEWGERDGKPFEDRYDAVVCEVLSGRNHVCDLAIYQHWFKRDRKEYPAVGSEITTKQVEFREKMFNPVRGLYTIELDEFDKLRIAPTNKSSLSPQSAAQAEL